MAARNTYDIVVLGNGVVGLSTAVSIVRENPDAKLAVVGPAAMPGNASLAAGAMLASFGEIEAGSLGHPVDRYVFDLNRKANELWPAWAAMLSEADPKNPLTINNGTYVINNTRADDLDDT